MKNKDKAPEKAYRLLKQIFVINLTLLVAATGYLMYIKGPVWGDGVEPNVIFERYAIILTLAAIPLALKLFHTKIKKYESLTDELFTAKYKLHYIIRLAILDFVVIFNLVGFYLFESQNLILMALIGLFSVLFCYPNKSMLTTPQEVKVGEEEETESEEEQETYTPEDETEKQTIQKVETEKEQEI